MTPVTEGTGGGSAEEEGLSRNVLGGEPGQLQSSASLSSAARFFFFFFFQPKAQFPVHSGLHRRCTCVKNPKKPTSLSQTCERIRLFQLDLLMCLGRLNGEHPTAAAGRVESHNDTSLHSENAVTPQEGDRCDLSANAPCLAGYAQSGLRSLNENTEI